MVNLERDVVLFLHGDGWMDTEKNETWSGGSVVVDRERRNGRKELDEVFLNAKVGSRPL